MKIHVYGHYFHLHVVDYDMRSFNVKTREVIAYPYELLVCMFPFIKY